MHLFFNDPRVAYVTKHRRTERHPLLTLVAGGVGVAALGVAIGAVGWEPSQHEQPDRQGQQRQQLGVVMPEPVVAFFDDVPAAPQPVFGVPAPTRTLAAPQPARSPEAAPRTKVKQTEKASRIQPPVEVTQSPAPQPSQSESPSPTENPSPTDSPSESPSPTESPTASAEPTQQPQQQHNWPPFHWWDNDRA